MEKMFKVKTIHEDIRTYVHANDKLCLTHIHFGYWLNPGESFGVAQENLYNLIRNFIPRGVKDILDVGGGIGGVSIRLLRENYRPVCIVPDPLLIEIGRESFPDLFFLRGTAEFFKVRKKCDMALLLESFQYFSAPERALSNIDKHLNDGGYVMLVDEFWVDDKIKKTEDFLPKFFETRKYRVIQQLELTKEIIPTCDFLIECFKDINERYVRKWRRTKELYLSGKKRYFLFLLQKQKSLLL